MNLSDLTLDKLNALKKLLLSKQTYIDHIKLIDKQINDLAAGKPTRKKRKKAAPKKAKRKAATKGAAKAKKPKAAKARRPKTKTKAKASKAPRKSKRTSLKPRILAVLKEAGDKGLHVKDIANQVKSPLPSVRVWFHTTGKPLIRKVSKATYALRKELTS